MNIHPQNSASNRNLVIPEEPSYIPQGRREPYNRTQQRVIAETNTNEEDEILAKVLEESK
tara:strand:+ start:555 stop:734 length:180 start_codon:yes stop_codon:yes gene_type:complete